MKNSSLFSFILSMVIGLQLCFVSSLAAASPRNTKAIEPKMPVPPQLTSRAAIVVDADTERVLFTKNADAKNYPASTTKIMTALLALEKGKMSDVFTVAQEDLSLPKSYESYFLLPGERLTVKDLLHDLLILSDNGAGMALARYVEGSVPKFVEQMNKRAVLLGCKQTHFANPYGFHEEQHFTSCHDLYLMAKAAMQHYYFRKIVRTCTYTLPATNIYPKQDRLLENTNLLLWDDEIYYDKRCQGIKTGYTNAAGRCLVAMASDKKVRLYVVVLGGSKINGIDQRFMDAKKLFDYGFAIKTRKIKGVRNAGV